MHKNSKFKNSTFLRKIEYSYFCYYKAKIITLHWQPVAINVDNMILHYIKLICFQMLEQEWNPWKNDIFALNNKVY